MRALVGDLQAAKAAAAKRGWRRTARGWIDEEGVSVFWAEYPHELRRVAPGDTVYVAPGWERTEEWGGGYLGADAAQRRLCVKEV